MKMIKTLAAIWLISISMGSFAESGAEQEAQKLFNTLGMDSALKETIVRMVDLQLQQNPAMGPYKQVMLAFFDKHMNYESLKPDLIAIYTEVFTEKELKELNDFYATDTGKKTIETMPELMSRGGQIGMQRVQDNIQELDQMIAEESARIQALQSK